MGDGVEEEGQGAWASAWAAGSRCHPMPLSSHSMPLSALLLASKPDPRPAAVWNDFEHTKCRSRLCSWTPAGVRVPSTVSHSRLRATFCTRDACEHDMTVNVCTPVCSRR
jgi:hypothetical protein